MLVIEAVSKDLLFIAQAILFLLESITAALLLSLLYLVFAGKALYSARQLGIRGSRAMRLTCFALTCAVTLALAHTALMRVGLLTATISLLGGLLGSALVYWTLIRPLNPPGDMRVPNTILTLTGVSLLALCSLAALWIVRERVKLEGITLDTLAQIAGITVAGVSATYTYLMTAEQSNRTARQQIYQSLELQSINLFRFEIEKKDIAAMLWEADDPPENQEELYRLKQHVFQTLNLFEMAYRFQLEGILPPGIFGSWVIWMWELASAPVFQKLWRDKDDSMPLNYVPDFRRVIDFAVHLHDMPADTDAERHRKEFFWWVADRVGCPMTKRWLDQPKEHTQHRIA